MAKAEKARLQNKYEKEIMSALMKEFGYKNVMEVPRLEKIVINCRVGDATQDKKRITGALEDLARISGQKAIATKARKSIATFKLREGMEIGAKVTLRRKRMYEFLDRFVNIALPRVRDFRGLPKKSFDGRGNYSCGLKEQIVFPEIDYDKVDKIRGMDVIFVTSAKNDNEARALLKAFNMPIMS